MKETTTPDIVEEFVSRYPFSLDPFQIEAIKHLSEDRSVLVVAPTGSGKTVVAEFAVWAAERSGLKTFYTTPLKALSNQKFRDLRNQYGPEKVGLLTGDNSINPEAPVVIMTTEVLRNMIYERSPSLYGLKYVVLDECHYLMDPFRGAVWEEIIIHLPADVKIIALSATVSNYAEFGEWLNALRGDVRTVFHGERPVPLRHFFMVDGIMVNLLSSKAPRIVAELERSAGRRKGGRRPNPRHLIPRRAEVVERLRRSGMLPAIYFIFSRAGCDAAIGHCMEAGMDLTSAGEKRVIEDTVQERVSFLPQQDLKVFNFDLWLEALKKGLASHHAGLLPLFKELVEDLFAQGLIKVVFATETLSLGINMPAKTVVIESLFKFSGEAHEFLTPTEYTQFTGRAGRRGIDSVGNAVTLYNPMVSFEEVRRLAQAESLPITSSFTLSYNMAVNLLRYYDHETAVHLLNSSFAQFLADREVVRLERARNRVESRLAEMEREIACDRGDVEDYYGLRRRLSHLEKEAAEERRRRRRELIQREMEELSLGDVVVVQRKGERRAAVVLGISEDRNGNPRLTVMDSRGRFLKATHQHFPHPPQAITHLPPSLLSPTGRIREREVRRFLRELELPEPEKWEDETLPHLREEIAETRERLAAHPCHSCPRREDCVFDFRRVLDLRREAQNIVAQMQSRSEVASRKLENVKRLLGRLGYLEDGSPTPRGLVLGRIYNECDLLLVETMEEGVFHLLGPEEVAAFASIFVFESREAGSIRERSERTRAKEKATYPTPRLAKAIEWALARQEEIKEMEREEGLDLLRPVDTGFVPVAYDWASGEDLEYITATYPQYSAGDFVRCMKQVIDLLRQIKEASADGVLSTLASSAMDLVDRSIVAYTSIVDAIQGGEEVERSQDLEEGEAEDAG
ncbi:MAG: DEAD/DEAH box helicase [Candidatus Geothermincolales bacterium]